MHDPGFIFPQHQGNIAIGSTLWPRVRTSRKLIQQPAQLLVLSDKSALFVRPGKKLWIIPD